jgi:hypothetical protein
MWAASAIGQCLGWTEGLGYPGNFSSARDLIDNQHHPAPDRTRANAKHEMSRLSLVHPVTVTIMGATFEGRYYVQHQMVHVHSSLGSKVTRLGKSPPEAMAKLLLLELVRESRTYRHPVGP